MSLMPTALIFSNLAFSSSQDGKSIELIESLWSIEPIYRVLPLVFTGVRLVNMDSWRVALSILWSPSFLILLLWDFVSFAPLAFWAAM